MSGQAGAKGYLVQALVAVLCALEEQNDWVLIEIEPNNADNKVDIRWSLKDDTLRVTQVKSSGDLIEFRDIIKWLTDLINGTPNAQEYELRLLGGHSQRVIDLSKASFGKNTKMSLKIKEKLPSLLKKNFAKIKIPDVFPLNLQDLKDIASTRLERFLKSQKLSVPKLDDRYIIINNLITDFFEHSTNGKPISRYDLEAHIKNMVSKFVRWRKKSNKPNKTDEELYYSLQKYSDLSSPQILLMDIYKYFINRFINLDSSDALELATSAGRDYLNLCYNRGTEKEMIEALRYYYQIFTACITLGDLHRAIRVACDAIILNRTLHDYNNNYDWRNAKDILSKAEVLLYSKKIDRVSKIDLFSEKSRIFYLEGDYKSSYNFANSALVLSQDTGDPDQIDKTQNVLARALTKIPKGYEVALNLLTHNLSWPEYSIRPVIRKNILALIYFFLGEKDQALNIVQNIILECKEKKFSHQLLRAKDTLNKIQGNIK